LALGWSPPICAENADIAPVGEAENQGTNGKQHLDESRQ
jgi:hypothetical protein